MLTPVLTRKTLLKVLFSSFLHRRDAKTPRIFSVFFKSAKNSTSNGFGKRALHLCKKLLFFTWSVCYNKAYEKSCIRRVGISVLQRLPKPLRRVRLPYPAPETPVANAAGVFHGKRRFFMIYYDKKGGDTL